MGKEDLRLALLVVGFIFLSLFFVKEVIYISKALQTETLNIGLSSFESLFQRFFLGFLLDMVTSPSVWLGAIFLFIAHKIKIKGKKSEQN